MPAAVGLAIFTTDDRAHDSALAGNASSRLRFDHSAMVGSEGMAYIWRVFVCIPTVTVPLLISSLRATSVMAMVADARAFGSHKARTTLQEHQTTWADRIALGMLVALTLTVLILISLHIGNRQI